MFKINRERGKLKSGGKGKEKITTEEDMAKSEGEGLFYNVLLVPFPAIDSFSLVYYTWFTYPLAIK